MARELGLNPKKLGKLADTRDAPWKVPLAEFIAECYYKAHKRREPEHVRSLEQVIEAAEAKKARRKERKALRNQAALAEGPPGGEEPSFARAVTETPIATSVDVTDDSVCVELADGRSVSAPLVWFPRLLRAAPDVRKNWKLIGAGGGIHWPEIDEDISVAGLLRGERSGERP